jgi:hypothetical protein
VLSAYVLFSEPRLRTAPATSSPKRQSLAQKAVINVFDTLNKATDGSLERPLETVEPLATDLGSPWTPPAAVMTRIAWLMLSTTTAAARIS